MPAKEQASPPTSSSASASEPSPDMVHEGDDIKAPSNHRGPSSTHVTNACSACKKRRTKCDGKNPCFKCAKRPGTVCKYELSLKATKLEIKQEISALQQREAVSSEILAALAADQGVPAILRKLQGHDDLSSIVGMIRSPNSSKAPSSSSSSEPYDMSVGSLLERYGSTDASPVKVEYESSSSSPSDMNTGIFSTAIHGDSSQMIQPQSVQEMRSNACRGPTDLSDHRLIRHLFSVYWVWIHPDHTILNMPLFVKSYEAGSEAYCSTFLVYAVCIAACDHLDPNWEAVEGKATDVAELRQNLIANARNLAATVDLDAEANMQALAVLSLIKSWA